MLRIVNYLKGTHPMPRSIVINNYYGYSRGLSAFEHEVSVRDSEEEEETSRFLMPRAVFDEVLEILSSIPPEACGVFLGPQSHGSLITHFIRDETGIPSPTMFRIDGERLTKAIHPYVTAGLDVKGIAHSHPSGIYRPSNGDLRYLRKLFGNRKNADAPELDFYFPIISDGQVFHYAFDRSAGRDRLKPAKVVLI